jgi:hypothetical protein
MESEIVNEINVSNEVEETSKQINVSNEVGDETFEYEEKDHEKDHEKDSEVINTEHFKYTKIDCLDEDKAIANQRFCLLSFISPEGLMNCKIRGVKVRGVYATEDEAKRACEQLKKKDKYFDVFIGEVGKWLPWDSVKQSEQVKFRNERLDKLMQKTQTRVTDCDNLNELVGRKKELLDKEKGNHKARVKDAIKENIANMEEQNNTDVMPEPEKTKVPRSAHDNSAVRNRLKKLVEEREKSKATERMSTNVQNNVKDKQVEVLEHYKNNLKNESDRVLEKHNNVDKLASVSDELADKIAIMKKHKESLLKKNKK